MTYRSQHENQQKQRSHDAGGYRTTLKAISPLEAGKAESGRATDIKTDRQTDLQQQCAAGEDCAAAVRLDQGESGGLRADLGAGLAGPGAAPGSGAHQGHLKPACSCLDMLHLVGLLNRLPGLELLPPLCTEQMFTASLRQLGEDGVASSILVRLMLLF